MKTYLVNGEVLSPLLFVSSSYGAKTKVDEVISHFALMYALNDREIYACPEMKEELYTELNEFEFKCSAARFAQISRRNKTYSSRPDYYFDWPIYPRTPSGKKRNLPVKGEHEEITPRSKFWFVLKSKEKPPTLITLGKKRAYVRLEFSPLEKLTETNGVFRTDVPVYYGDMADLDITALETSILTAGHHLYMIGKFEGPYELYRGRGGRNYALSL
jgi:hypothetical protein